MPRKSRAKKAPATEPTLHEPTPVAAVLAQSPIMAEILDARDAKSRVEPEHPMPDPGAEAVVAFQRQHERENAVTEPPSRLEALGAEALVESQKPKGSHTERLKGLRPTPSGFIGLESFRNAGIRLSRSLDKQTVAIQFADDHRPSKDGLNPETQRLGDRGFSYKPERAQWERRDREQPAENYQDAKAFVASLVADRVAGMGRA